MGAVCLLVSLLASFSALVFGLVVPERSAQRPLTTAKTTWRKEHRPWDTPPSDSQPNNLIFFRLATLLQHWPNTRYPSGQSVVPGIIPIGTTLYHGRHLPDVPTSPDWLAFDPEHSILFTLGAKGRLFTFVTTRPLRILYFDGSSAAELTSGSMDTQDLLAWGQIRNGTMWDEMDRIIDLCEWGERFRIDGYVRMEMSFEVMYCDFSQGLELVSSLHIVPPKNNGKPLHGHDPTTPPPPPRSPVDRRLKSLSPAPTERPHRPPIFPPPEPRPPNWKGPLPDAEVRLFEIFQAGMWHNRVPGEVRIKLNTAKLVSVYDPALSSGAKTRDGKEKVLHRAKGMSVEDISTWRGWINAVLHEDAPRTSGVDWPALTTVIMDRYGDRLEHLQYLLHPDRISQNASAVIQGVRAHLMLMLATDITANYVPTSTLSASSPSLSQARRDDTQNYTWAEPIASHCSSFLVSHLPKERMTREEHTLYAAVAGTQTEICRVLSLLWADVYDPLPLAQAKEMLRDWKERVDGLVGWLDWPMWNRCKPECSLDTVCFIPTWPIGVGGPGREGEDLSKIDWTPKCSPRRVTLPTYDSR